MQDERLTYPLASPYLGDDQVFEKGHSSSIVLTRQSGRPRQERRKTPTDHIPRPLGASTTNHRAGRHTPRHVYTIGLRGCAPPLGVDPVQTGPDGYQEANLVPLCRPRSSFRKRVKSRAVSAVEVVIGGPSVDGAFAARDHAGSGPEITEPCPDWILIARSGPAL